MKRRIDDLGRLVIPAEMRKEIGIENGSEVDMELEDNKIILTNPKSIKSKEEIERKINILTNEYSFGENILVDGYVEALKWVLNEED